MTPSTASDNPNNTQTVARNSFWYGLDLMSGLVSALLVSVIVARVFGPVRLSYYTYIMWLTNITATVGAFGLPMTTRKYMAEYLSRGQRGVARSIYIATLRLQFFIAAGLTAAGLLLVLFLGDPTQRLLAVFLVGNIGPRMLGFIPSQANNASEAVRRNTLPSVISGFVNLGLSLLAIWLGLGLAGVAAGYLAGTLLDTVWKLRIVYSWLGDAVPAGAPPGLNRQMFVYSGQGLALMILNVVIWDRSDLVFLKALNHDPTQVTFFSYSFNLVERLLMFPNTLAGSLGVTIMAQYGRGESKLGVLTVEGARYAFIIAVPLLVGMACVAGPASLLLYGGQFQPIAPVLAIVALMAIPKAITAPPTLLLQATENQGFLVVWGCCCGAVNIALDILLTPRYGAVGAAIANGTAQALGALGTWIRAWRLFSLDMRPAAFARIVVSALGLAAAAIAVSRAIPGFVGLFAAIPTGAFVWFALLRWTGAIDTMDAQRLGNAGRAFPARFYRAWMLLIGLITSEAPASVPDRSGA